MTDLMAIIQSGNGNIKLEVTGEDLLMFSNQLISRAKHELSTAIAEAAEDVTTLRVVLKGISMEDERQRVWFDEYNKALAEAGIPAKLEVVEMQSGTDRKSVV